jgi:hypothetical protein
VSSNSHPATDRDTSVLLPEGHCGVTAEQVATVVAGIPAIGRACEALKNAGWQTGIAGNRITVDDEVFAQFLGPTVGAYGAVEATWVIYSIAGTPPVWIVGAEPPRHTSESATGMWPELGRAAGDTQTWTGQPSRSYQVRTPAQPAVAMQSTCAAEYSTGRWKE